MEISGTTALVTGAASGLGAATAERLAARGARVLGLDLAPSIERAAPVDGVRLHAADVTSEGEVQAALDTLAGEPPLRIVVTCAGIAPARRILSSKGVHELDLFRRTIEVNLIGTFNVLRLAAAVIASTDPVDEAGQRGVIVTTASVAAYEGQIGQAAYA
ncbi:SDR family NAD(P)-dependent oxidoreductase, partial [Mesorhizobium japonicum]|uniref:SDR family NAD(P)-dependent oxidoreductase n=1 Tax=Mesorhizobium japonicum TaxID=2066070 RepID=UPI003B5B39C6